MSRPSRYELTDHQWGRLEDLLQGKASDAGRSGLDSRAFVAQIEAVGAHAVIPPRSCQQARPFDAKLYRARNAIERCFGRLKQFRRIATRYDRIGLSLHGLPLPRCKSGLAASLNVDSA